MSARRSGYSKTPKGLTSKGADIDPRFTITQALRAQVQKLANTIPTTMVIGWQHDEFTASKRSIGYCPKAAVGPAFVYEVLETIEPIIVQPASAPQCTCETRGAGDRACPVCFAPPKRPTSVVEQAHREVDELVKLRVIDAAHGAGIKLMLSPTVVEGYCEQGLTIRDMIDCHLDISRMTPPKGSALAQVLADPSKLRAVVGAQLPAEAQAPFRRVGNDAPVDPIGQLINEARLIVQRCENTAIGCAFLKDAIEAAGAPPAEAVMNRRYVQRNYPLPEGVFGAPESAKLLLKMYPTAVLHGRVPGSYKIPGIGRAVTTCRAVVTWTRPSAQPAEEAT